MWPRGLQAESREQGEEFNSGSRVEACAQLGLAAKTLHGGQAQASSTAAYSERCCLTFAANLVGSS